MSAPAVLAPERAKGTGDREGARRQGRGGRLPAWVAIAALVVGLVFAPPWTTDDGLPAGFAARLVEGDLERLTGDSWVKVEPGALVRDDATVRSGAGARLTVPGGGLALAPATQAALTTPVELTVGALLVEVADRERSVRVGQLIAAGRGTWRVDALGAHRVGVYRGGVGIRGSARAGCRGEDRACVGVGRLQQASVVGGRVPARALPLQYHRDDPWDARLLGDVLATDAAVRQLAVGFAGRYGGAPRPRSFYLAFRGAPDALTVLGQLTASDGAELMGPPPEVLVSLVVTQLLVDRAALTAEQSAEEVTRLRRDGATWGIVLALHGLGADDLRVELDLALASAPPGGLGGASAGGPPGAQPGVPTAAAGTRGPSAGGGGVAPPPGGGGSPDGPQPTGPPSSPPPSGGEPPPPPEEPGPIPCELPACDLVDDVLDEPVEDLTDLIDGVVPGAGETVEDVISELPTLLPEEQGSGLVRAPSSLTGDPQPASSSSLTSGSGSGPVPSSATGESGPGSAPSSPTGDPHPDPAQSLPSTESGGGVVP